MLKILNKFFDFCGSVNKKKFQISIVLGVIQAVCEAMKIPAEKKSKLKMNLADRNNLRTGIPNLLKFITAVNS